MKSLLMFFIGISIFLISCDNNDQELKPQLAASIYIGEQGLKVWKDTSIKLTIQIYGGMPQPDGSYYNKVYTYNRNDLSNDQLTLLDTIKMVSPDCDSMCLDCMESTVTIYDTDGSSVTYKDDNNPSCNAGQDNKYIAYSSIEQFLMISPMVACNTAGQKSEMPLMACYAPTGM